MNDANGGSVPMAVDDPSFVPDDTSSNTVAALLESNVLNGKENETDENSKPNVPRCPEPETSDHDLPNIPNKPKAKDKNVSLSTKLSDMMNQMSIKEMMKYALEHDEDTKKDVTFIVGPEEVPFSGHRLFLGIISPLLQKMFQLPSLRNEEHPTFLLPDVSSTSFKHFLEYVYLRRIDLVDINEAIDLLMLAHRFKLPDLATKCMTVIKAGLNSTNAIEILQKTWKFSDPELKELALSEIASNAKNILKTEGFLKLDCDQLGVVLESNLDEEEFSIFQAAKRWALASIKRKRETEDIKYNPNETENIRNELGNNLFLIRFPLMTCQEFQSVSSSGILTIEEAYKVLERMVPGYEASAEAHALFSAEPRKNPKGVKVAPAKSPSSCTNKTEDSAAD